MIFDIIILIILLLTMVFGFRRGFVYSFIHTLSLIGTLIAAFFGARFMQGHLEERTMIDDNLYSNLFERFSSTMDSALSPLDTLPLILGRKVEAASGDTAALAAEKLTDFLMLVLSFLILFIAIKLICYLIILFFSRKNSDGFIGAVDGLLGMLAGFIKGVLIVFIVLALLVPGMNFMSTASAELFMAALDNSYVAKTLYDANFLLLILGV